MSNTGKRFVQAITESNNIDREDFLAGMFDTLKERPLVDRDFEKAKSLLRAIGDRLDEKIQLDVTDSADANPKQPVKDRHFEHFMLYMGVRPEVLDHVAPLSDWVEIKSRRVVSVVRGFPLRIQSSHTERQHIGRMSNPLQYNGDDIRFASMFSLPLSLAIGSLQGSRLDASRFVMPHVKGLFYGETEPYSETSPQSHYLTREGVRGKTPRTLIGGAIVCPTTLQVNTSISFADMSDGQWRLYDVLKPLMDERDLLRVAVQLYAWGPEIKTKATTELAEGWKDLVHRLTDIVKSDLWQRDIRATKEGFVRKAALEQLRRDGLAR